MLKHSTSIKISVLLTLLACLTAVFTVQARNKDFILELTFFTDKDEEVLHIVELDDREFRNLRNDPGREIQNYLVEARKKHADEIGYRHEIYGDGNFKMVVVAKFQYIVKDKSSGRILLSK